MKMVLVSLAPVGLAALSGLALPMLGLSVSMKKSHLGATRPPNRIRSRRMNRFVDVPSLAGVSSHSACGWARKPNRIDADPSFVSTCHWAAAGAAVRNEPTATTRPAAWRIHAWRIVPSYSAPMR